MHNDSQICCQITGFYNLILLVIFSRLPSVNIKKTEQKRNQQNIKTYSFSKFHVWKALNEWCPNSDSFIEFKLI